MGFQSLFYNGVQTIIPHDPQVNLFPHNTHLQTNCSTSDFLFSFHRCVKLPAQLSQVFLTLLISDHMYLWSYDPKHFEKPQFHAWVVCLDCGIYCAYTNHGSSTGLINWWLLQSLYMAHPPTSEQATSHGTSRQMCGTDVVQHHPRNLNQEESSSILHNIHGIWRKF